MLVYQRVTRHLLGCNWDINLDRTWNIYIASNSWEYNIISGHMGYRTDNKHKQGKIRCIIYIYIMIFIYNDIYI